MCQDNASPPLSRRGLMAGAGAVLAASALPFARARAEDPKAPAPNAISPSEALERLMRGNERYAANQALETDFSAAHVAKAQSPYPIAAVLACSDAPVSPEIVFDQPPGSLFVVRDAGNATSDYAIASLEYAVNVAGVPLVVVLGHAECSVVLMALQATRTRAELPGRMQEILKLISPPVIIAHGKHASDPLAAAVEENVRYGMKRLKEQSEIVGAAVNQGKVAIKGGVYDLATGAVKLL